MKWARKRLFSAVRATVRIGLSTAAALATACSGPQAGPATTSAPQPRLLLPGEDYPGSVAAGATDRYRVDLAPGDSLLLEATQGEVDLLVRVLDPGGRAVLAFDSSTGTAAPERVCVIAGRGGTYGVEVEPFTGHGTYALRALHRRPATEADRRCGEAATAFSASKSAGDRPEGIGHAEAAGRLWEDAGEAFLAAMAWSDAAWLRLEQGETAQAVAGLERALVLAGRAGSPRLESRILNRHGLALRDAGDLPGAAAALDRALDLSRAFGYPRGTAAALTNRGLVDEEMGEPHRAVDRYREALALWRQEDDPGELAQTLTNLGDVLGVLDHHDEALDALEEALDVARGARDLGRQANALVAIGWIHRLRGEPTRSLPPLREALALRRADRDAKGEAGVLDRLGTVLSLAGDPEAAEAAYRSSLEISERLDLPGYRAATRTNLGCLLAETARGGEAAEFLAAALGYLEAAKDPKAWSQAEYCSALLARSRAEADAALDHARRALSIVESLRARARADGHHYRPIWLWQDYAELEVSLLLDRFRALGDRRDLAGAFAAADRMRARTLYEVVVRTRAGARRAAARPLEARASEIQTRINELGADRRARLAEAPSPPAETGVDAEIRRLQLELEHLRAEMRAAARSAGDLGLPRSVGASEAQSLLGPRTALLTYVLGSRQSHLLVLTRESLETFELASEEVLEAHAEGLYHALEESRDAGRQWRLVSSAAGRLLLPPEAIPPDVDWLLVAAEGSLLYVPFAALASPRAGPGGAERLVLDDFDVVTVPSASVLAALRARREGRGPAPKPVAVFADPVFSRDDALARASGPAPLPTAGSGSPAPPTERLARGIVAERLPGGPLPRLPATRDEAAAILARVPAGESLARIGFDASKQAVLSADLRPYRILHFATHAWVDERFPELSGLVLSTVDSAGREIDGALYLHEIDRLELGADLTVLSGCQTALGRRVRGDGLLGLTQGFLRAGSSQVLVSLWSLDDQGAARLMDEFYRRLLDGETAAAALRGAQRWLREQEGFEGPRYWAPFVLQGDG